MNLLLSDEKPLMEDSNEKPLMNKISIFLMFLSKYGQFLFPYLEILQKYFKKLKKFDVSDV